MPSSNPPSEPDIVSADPVTPRTPAKRNNHATTTPTKKSSSPDAAPKSAPAAAAGRSTSKKQEPPTLLTDFLMGRPSAARVAADRHRRKSLDAVKAEMRHEMRQSAVRRVQPPGASRTESSRGRNRTQRPWLPLRRMTLPLNRQTWLSKVKTWTV